MIDESGDDFTSSLIRFRLRRRRVRPEITTVMVILSLATAVLWISNIRFERMLEREQARVEGLAELIEEADRASFTREDFARARGDLEFVLADTAERVRSLEAAAGARERVIAEAAASIVFIQGSYGFVNPDTDRPLRYFYGQGDRPLRMPDGMTMVTTGGNGPIVNIFYTGTGFIVDQQGLLITNRHVAYPWEFEANAQFTLKAGFRADRRGFIGFLPGVEEHFDLEIVAASDSGADVALLRIVRLYPPDLDAAPFVVPAALAIAAADPDPGDEVVVMGYPAGVEALLARSDQRFAEGLLARGPVTFWEVGQALAIGGYIQPLSTQGIVGQVTNSMIVYDADTGSGGSGGPVLGLDGAVVAVNTAILEQFSGSNLGVPAREVRALLAAFGGREQSP